MQNYTPSSSHTNDNAFYYATSRAVYNAYSISRSHSMAYTDVHRDDNDNPHNVNKSDVGLSRVPNWYAGQSSLGVSPSTFPNELSVRTYIDSAISSAVSLHFQKTMPIGIVIALADGDYSPASLGWSGAWVMISSGTKLSQVSTGETLGSQYGSNGVKLNANNLPPHTHSNNFSILDLGHQHEINTPHVIDVNNNGSADVLHEISGVGGKFTESASANTHLTGSVGNNSTLNQNIDVSGKHLAVTFWRRIS